MKVVVVGDVSWAGLYHLGDEAMTEVAVAQLQRHGAEVTLVAGDPAMSAEHYRVATVGRLGFRGVPRPRKLKMLSALESALSGEAAVPTAMAPALEAVRRADGLVIAGGGNLNSVGEHHLFERLALTRIAEFFEVPLFVSSQTVGPQLSPEDLEIVKEIAEYASVFGVRERSSALLMRDLSDAPERVVLTFDDAILLPRLARSSVPTVELDLPQTYVVGSFTHHAGDTGLSDTEYYRTIASALDQVVDSRDLDVVLVPHMGVLGADDATDHDGAAHARIAELMTSPRVHRLPVLSAAQAVSVTAAAAFTLSTRYHPVVFGPSVGVPAVGLVTSHYSMIRMRGALEHVGMGSFAIPYESWDGLFGPRVLDALAVDREQLRSHLDLVVPAAARYQTAWWDGIVDSMRGSGDVVTQDLPAPPPYEWGTPADRESFAVFTGLHDALNRTKVRLSLEAREHTREVRERIREVKDLRQQIAALTQDGERLRQENRQLEQGLADHAEEALASQRSLQRQIDGIRHKQRPPGAALRDGARRRLRRWRESR